MTIYLCEYGHPNGNGINTRSTQAMLPRDQNARDET